MHSVWPLQDAKNRFSEVVQKAHLEGPQLVTRHGKESAVVISIEDFRSLTASDENLVEFFRKSPLSGAGIDLTRDRDPGRDVDL